MADPKATPTPERKPKEPIPPRFSRGAAPAGDKPFDPVRTMVDSFEAGAKGVVDKVKAAPGKVVKKVKNVVGFANGGSVGSSSQKIANGLSSAWGQPVPGAKSAPVPGAKKGKKLPRKAGK